MRRYSLFHPLYLSFFSKELYQDVLKNWKGTVFLYLLMLLALTWIPVMVSTHLSISEFITKDAPQYLDQIPKITITKGVVSIDQPMPYAIKHPATGVPLLVIDTSGQISTLEQTPAIALLTKTKFLVRRSNTIETRTYDLSQIESVTIDRERVTGWARIFNHWFAIVAYPFALAFSYAYRIIQALLYAIIGMLFVKGLKVSLGYSDILRLALVAITPVILLNTIVTLLGIKIPYFPLICFLIAMGYLFFALKATTEKKPEQERG